MSIERKLAKQPYIHAITVGTAAQQLVTENPTRKGLLVINLGAITVYVLSAQNQTITDGIPIVTNGSYSNSDCYGAYWIIAGSGSNNVRVEEDCD